VRGWVNSLGSLLADSALARLLEIVMGKVNLAVEIVPERLKGC
jgi:hypothetical protein